MLAHVINSIYVVVLVVYYFPFAMTLVTTTGVDAGLLDTYPAWVDDTSRKGFWLSPFRMVKEFIA